MDHSGGADHGDCLIASQIIADYQFDAENVYEWPIAPLAISRATLNISRKWWQDPGDLNDVSDIVEFSLEAPRRTHTRKQLAELVPIIAKIVHDRLNWDVEIGRITFLRDDVIEYRAEQVLARKHTKI